MKYIDNWLIHRIVRTKPLRIYTIPEKNFKLTCPDCNYKWCKRVRPQRRKYYDTTFDGKFIAVLIIATEMIGNCPRCEKNYRISLFKTSFNITPKLYEYLIQEFTTGKDDLVALSIKYSLPVRLLTKIHAVYARKLSSTEDSVRLEA